MQKCSIKNMTCRNVLICFVKMTRKKQKMDNKNENGWINT